jgi:hypothetical protein
MFQVLKAASMKKTAFWDIEPLISLKQTDVSEDLAIMEAVRASETSAYFNDTTRSYIPDGCHLK